MSQPQFECLAVTSHNTVTSIALDRPETLNALSWHMVGELNDALDAAASDPGVRAVVLTGTGRAFSSGADLKDRNSPRNAAGLPDLGRGLRTTYNLPVAKLRTIPKPVVAAVNGPAVGIALSYALACDFVLAARSAYFMLSFVNVGLVPDGGASVLVPARTGLTKAVELAMLAERLDADDALAAGMINAVVPDDELPATSLKLAHRLAGGPPQALASIKRMVNATSLKDLDAALELEADLQERQAGSAEFREGIAAFIEKRRPRFGTPSDRPTLGDDT